LGFSAIEIIIVIAIMAVLSSVVIAGFVFFGNNSNLNNDAEGFISALKLAQNKTVSSEAQGGQASQYGVYINTLTSPNQYILFKGLSYANRDVSLDRVNYLSNSTEFYSINIAGGGLSGYEIVFNRLTGETQESGNISIRSKSDQSKNKTIYIATSGAVSYSPSGSSLDSYRLGDSRHAEFRYSKVINTLSDVITLNFNGSQTAAINISEHMSGGQLRWKDTIDVGGSDQTVEVETIRINNPDTLFSVFRDRRHNNKSLEITMSGDTTGYLAHYDADGVTSNPTSIYVSEFKTK
jgi:Tfp pilus assembly protein FimT